MCLICSTAGLGWLSRASVALELGGVGGTGFAVGLRVLDGSSIPAGLGGPGCIGVCLIGIAFCLVKRKCICILCASVVDRLSVRPASLPSVRQELKVRRSQPVGLSWMAASMSAGESIFPISQSMAWCSSQYIAELSPIAILKFSAFRSLARAE